VAEELAFDERAQAGSRAPKAPREARAKPLDAAEHAGTIGKEAERKG
jgi:hypothetical protein